MNVGAAIYGGVALYEYMVSTFGRWGKVQYMCVFMLKVSISVAVHMWWRHVTEPDKLNFRTWDENKFTLLVWIQLNLFSLPGKEAIYAPYVDLILSN